MRPYHILSLVLLAATTAAAQLQWSSPVQITTGVHDDQHPAFVISPLFVSGGNEWLAFSRGSSDPPGRAICLTRPHPFTATWPDSIFIVTDDTTINDYPSLGRRDLSLPLSEVMLAWERTTDERTDIYFTLIIDSAWSPPAKLPSSTGDDRRPCVASSDSGFGITWERAGQVMFAEYVNGLWRSAQAITPAGDSTNSVPQLLALAYPLSQRRWFVAWESAKGIAEEKAIMYSVSAGQTWSPPDTIAWTGDNRNPRFFKTSYLPNIDISWESNRTGDWEIFTGFASLYPDTLSWGTRNSNVSNNPLADDRSASFEVFPIITESSTFYHTAFTWVTSMQGSDSIAVKSIADWETAYRTPAPGTTDRHPDISSGTFGPLGIRVWSVWENNSTGHWKLYGVMRDIPLSVGEAATVAQAFRLYQNYPNPFNPTTTFSFDIPYSTFATLRVFDLLGREVARLVNEVMQPGSYERVFSAEGLASGVYFYQLKAGEFTGTKKLLLLR